MILLADGLHNFIGELGVGAAFMVDVKLGVITWLVAALHEIPQLKATSLFQQLIQFIMLLVGLIIMLALVLH